MVWKELGATANYSPFSIGTTDVTITSGARSTDVFILSSTIYNYVVVGVETTASPSVGICSCCMYKSGARWYAKIKLSGTVSSSTTFKLHYMGIHKAFVNDVR